MNLVSIVEIPVSDFARAKRFYEALLSVTLDEVDMGETHMGLVPGPETSVNLALVQGPGSTPSSQGTLVYLFAGEDLQPWLERAAAQGGQVLVPKTEISPEMGFFAQFRDCEGNTLGLHSLG